jgi:hypothetical protein
LPANLAWTLAACAVGVLLAACGGAGKPGEVDVSQAGEPQDEVAAAIDPRDPDVLIAGSNSWDEGQMRAYTSTDGAKTWKSELAPPIPDIAHAPRYPPADPAVAIDLLGREYYAFIADTGYAVRVFVATRAGAKSTWQVAQTPLANVTIGPPYASDDKDAIAVDLARVSPHRNRVYVAWSRSLFAPGARDPERVSIVIVHSDDGGVTWTAPATVISTSRHESFGFGASIAVAATGTVYVTWATLSGDIFVARAPDGVHFGSPRHVVARPAAARAGCVQVPRLRLSRLRSIGGRGYPYVAFDDERRHALVVWNRYACNGASDVWLTTFDASLRRRVGQHRVHPPDGAVAADQGLPVMTRDRGTNDIWVCYYDTGDDPTRRTTRYTCTVSADGGATFSNPQRAASVSSDETRPPAGKHGYGDYEAVVAAGGVAYPFWTDSRDLATRGEEIYTTSLRTPRS